MADRKAQIIIEQSEGRKRFCEAMRQIELGRTSFEEELLRFKSMRKACAHKGDDKLCRLWTIAERLLKKAFKEAKAAVVNASPLDESQAL